jgi:ABC-type Fe3+-hydroxamate transport system substrate-binding protein
MSSQAGPIDLADLLQLDPDAYLATSDSMLTLADLRRNPRTRKLRAVRKGRFMVVNVDLLQPGPQIGEGLTRIARLLHPNAFR